MKEEFKVATVFIGTIIGAGLASGQEILQFFALYGIKGLSGLLLCCALYITFTFIIINICFKYRLNSYKEVVDTVLGSKIGFVVDFFITFFILGAITIMISGGGAMLHEYAGINKSIGIFIMAGLGFMAAIFSTKGVVAVNSIIVPMSTLTIIVLGIIVFIKGAPSGDTISSITNSVVIKKGWALSAFLYSAFNLMGATGVLSPMIAESKSKKHFIRGAAIGSVVLTILAVIIYFSLLIYAPKSFYNEIPNLYIAKHFGNVLPLILTIIIWLEMFSTEVGDLYSLSKRVQHSMGLPYSTSLLIIMLFCIPISFIGFSKLIGILYPPYGVVGLIMLSGCVLKFIRIKR
jgi:uncharacterized membrane protein YkvI